MTEADKILQTVSRVTSVSMANILSRSRKWPVAEARMLFILFAAKVGFRDQELAYILGRNRTTVLQTRRKAADYVTVSVTFRARFAKIAQLYEEAPQSV